MLSNIASNLRNLDKTAFVINDSTYSYNELSRYVDKYHHLISMNPNWKVVGLMMHNDIETYAFMIATFLSDCGYVILNPAHPGDRNALIANEAGLSHVISSDLSDKGHIRGEFSFIDLRSVQDEATAAVYSEVDPDSIAYILFTSGSTGKPKGVRISKKNLDAFLGSLDATPISLQMEDSVLQLYDLTFDASILMLLPALCKGATIYTTNQTKMKLMDIARIFVTYPITYVFLVPSVISLLKNYIASINIPSLRTLLLGGEPVSKAVLDLIKPSVPNAQIWNFYGPTEATVGVVIGEISNVREDDLYNGIIPIGKPMPGVKHLIWDEGQIIHDVGRKGELLVGGDQVTEGYVNDAQKNLVSFVNLDYKGRSTRFYRTGDLVSLNFSGDFAYCGRLDHQVKIQGYRIELNEIEYYASQAAQTKAVAVIRDIDGNAQLILFLENYLGPVPAVIAYLEQKLPSYMVPKNVINVEQFPLSSAGKTDRMKLMELLWDDAL